MKICAAILVTLVSLVAHAEEFETSYGGQIVSASTDVAVKYADGFVSTFAVTGVESASVTNRSFMKVVSISEPSNGQCTRMIGELASDYYVEFKTDENEIVKLTFKASTAENKVRISGDCDNKISTHFSLYIEDDQALPMGVSMSKDPAGPPGPKAHYYGTVVAVTPTVFVRAEDGSVRELSATNLKVGGIYNDMKSIMLSINGAMTSCGNSLGELASDFSVTIRTKKGMVRKATVHAAAKDAPANDRVRVFGVCHSGAFTQLQLDTNNPALFEVQ